MPTDRKGAGVDYIDRFCEACSELFDAVYRPAVIVLLVVISYQLGSLG